MSRRRVVRDKTRTRSLGEEVHEGDFLLLVLLGSWELSAGDSGSITMRCRGCESRDLEVEAM